MDVNAIGLAGLSAAQQKFDQAAQRLASTDGSQEDMAADAVDLKSAGIQFQASLKAIHAADQMQKATIDLLA